MDVNDVVIVSAVRSAIGTYGGQFRNITNVPLGVPVMTEAIKRAGIDPPKSGGVGLDPRFPDQFERREVLIHF